MSAAPAGLKVRPASETDVPFLLSLRARTMSGHQRAAGLEPCPEECLTRVRFRFECAQIIEQGGTPLGLLKVAREGAAWQLIQIQIAPEYQGQGIGERFIRELIAEARAAGATLSLNVLHHNPARRLYERLGFRVIGQGEHELTMRLSA